MPTGYCKVPGCDNEAKGDFCSRCRSSFYYWTNKKSAHDMAKRLAKLEFYRKRTEFFLKPKYVGEKKAERTERLIDKERAKLFGAPKGA